MATEYIIRVAVEDSIVELDYQPRDLESAVYYAEGMCGGWGYTISEVTEIVVADTAKGIVPEIEI